MKQETLEKAAENYGWRIKTNTFSDQVKANELAESAKQDFIKGAKWQAERMYIEDEVLNILYQWSMYKIDIELERLADELPNILPYNEWFKQFKKKV